MTTLHGAPLPKDFEDNAPLPAAEFNAVKNYWVTDELPDTAEDGDVVFVIESDPVGGGLPGIGGWATVQSVSGAVEEKTFNDGDITWKVYKFTDDGFVTCSEAGLVEVLAVGSGGAGTGSGNHRLGGGGGGVIQQLTKLEAIPNPVVVGKGENQNAGQCSYVGDASLFSAVTAGHHPVRRLVLMTLPDHRMFVWSLGKDILGTLSVAAAVAALTAQEHQPKVALVVSSTLMVMVMLSMGVAGSRNTKACRPLVSVRAVTPGLVAQVVRMRVATGFSWCECRNRTQREL